MTFKPVKNGAVDRGTTYNLGNKLIRKSWVASELKTRNNFQQTTRLPNPIIDKPKYQLETELKRHNIAEHSNRPFACPHCPHRSKTEMKYDRHLLSHSTPRESYQCSYCTVGKNSHFWRIKICQNLKFHDG